MEVKLKSFTSSLKVIIWNSGTSGFMIVSTFALIFVMLISITLMQSQTTTIRFLSFWCTSAIEDLFSELTKKVVKSEEVLINSLIEAVSRSHTKIYKHLTITLYFSSTVFWDNVNSFLGIRYVVSTFPVCLNSFLTSLVYLSHKYT